MNIINFTRQSESAYKLYQIHVSGAGVIGAAWGQQCIVRRVELGGSSAWCGLQHHGDTGEAERAK